MKNTALSTKDKTLNGNDAQRIKEYNEVQLVVLKWNDAFTDSKKIADGTGNKHKSVVSLIKTHQKRLKTFGEIKFSDLKSPNPKGGRPTTVYFLNEPQATLLITFLDNTDIVADFKTELVRQFYAMRKFLIEKQSEQWKQTRIENKENRIKETDVIKMLVEYAKEQGSTHSDKLYMTYTKLAKTVIGGERKDLTVSELNTLTLVESIILQTIRIDMSMDMPYKDIYKDCKDRIERFAEIAYLTA